MYVYHIKFSKEKNYFLTYFSLTSVWISGYFKVKLRSLTLFISLQFALGANWQHDQQSCYLSRSFFLVLVLTWFLVCTARCTWASSRVVLEFEVVFCRVCFSIGHFRIVVAVFWWCLWVLTAPEHLELDLAT